MGYGPHGPELLTLQPSSYLVGMEVKVWFLSWKDGSVRKGLFCKHRDLSSILRAYIFLEVHT